MQIIKTISIVYCFVLLTFCAEAYGQSRFIPVTPFELEGVPLNITNPKIRYDAEEGMRVYCDIENVSNQVVDSFILWLLLYYENRDDPELSEYKSTDNIPPGETRNIFWDEPNSGEAPISGIITLLSIEISDNSHWRLRDYFAIQGGDIFKTVTPFTFPEVGTVTTIENDIGLLNSGTFRDLYEGQRLGVIRYSGDSIEKIAHIRLLKTLPIRSGFVVDYEYPGKEIQSSDRVQLLFPGITRLNATAKSLGMAAGLSAVSAGIFHYMRERNIDKIKDTIDADEKSRLSKSILDNKKRRDSALVTAGIMIGGAALSEFLWSHQGKYLHPPEFSLNPLYWNTTTRTFLSVGAVALGAGAYYSQQSKFSRNIMNSSGDQNRSNEYHGNYIANRENRDAAFVLAGTAISAGLLNQLILGNSWEIAKPGDEFVVRHRNQVSKSFLIMGGTAASAAAYFTIKKSQDNESLKKAVSPEETKRFEDKISKNRKRRDTAIFIAGTSLLTSAISQIWYSRRPGDVFFDKPVLPVPELSKISWYFTGLAAVSSAAALHFHENVSYAQTQYNGSFNLDTIQYYRNKVKTNEDRRQIALISSGITLGGAVVSYFLFRDNKRIPPGMNGSDSNPSNHEITWMPHFNPVTSSIGITLRF